ncbi:MAG: hypothetical protein ACK5L5_04160 [Bacteroidales bacterium]
MDAILLDDNYDVKIRPIRDTSGKIVSGFEIGNIDYQRAALIIDSEKGEFKAYPTWGFGVQKYLRSVPNITRQRFITELKNELKSDNINIKLTVGRNLKEFEITIQ